MSITDKTLEYYNQKALQFVEGTVDVEFSDLQNQFISRIKPGGKILDLGCGSGRDSKAFMAAGFEVTAIDGSSEICKIASQYIDQEVICSTFQDYSPAETFDGIWACATLLHLCLEDIKLVISKLAKSLAAEGSFYMSFKYGDFSGERNGRYFTDLTEDSFAEIINEIPELKIEKTFITVDARPDREEKWLNVFCGKR